MNSKALYQEVILDHNKKPRNYGTLPHASHHAQGHNPLCGDRIDVQLDIKDDGRIDAIAFEGQSCAICKASASMMTSAVKGKSRDDAERMINDFRDMATGKQQLDVPNTLGRLTVFAGVRDLPTRVKCAILPWHTLHAALNAQSITSTESDHDPMHAPIGDA